MRHARRLRRQLDEWQQVWRQVDAMVDRLETAREEDAVGREKTEALLAAAGVVERRRLAVGAAAVALSDPVVDRLPGTGWDRSTGQVVAVDAWGGPVRTGRLPGTEELELAVADLATVSLPPPFAEATGPLVLEKVLLFPSRATLRVDLDGENQLLRVPSYPGGAHPLTADEAVELEDVPTFFSAADRHAAATYVGDGSTDPPVFIATWSAVTLARRLAVPTAAEPPPYTTSTAGADAPLTSSLLALAADVVADALAAGPDPLPAGHAAVAAELASAAHGAATVPSTDADLLRAAADALDEHGPDADGDDLAGALRDTADGLRSSPDALLAVAEAASALAEALTQDAGARVVPPAVAAERSARAADLDAAMAALPGPGSLGGLLATDVELGPLGRELDAVLAGRLAYPDGSLRLLRTLEITFARWWPGLLRWMQLRCRAGGTLDRATAAFLGPFVSGLAGVVGGTDCGFAVENLELAAPVSTGAVSLPLDAPASMAAPLARVVEAGQIAVLAGDRPAAAVVLGLGRDQDHLALLTAALRVSLVSGKDVPGSPGLVAEGTECRDLVAAPTAAELRRGLAADPARDGLVEQAVALHGQLALLRGTSWLSARLGGAQVPDPPAPALHSVAWHGDVPAATSVFVLLGAPDAWWDREHGTPVPTLARPGELLLLRGQRPPEADESGAPATIQTVLEVDRAVWLSGSMLDRIDLGHAAVLATDPAALTEPGPGLLCGPYDDLVLLTARRTWQAGPLSGPVTLRRDFEGFDLASLAVQTPLGRDLVEDVTGFRPEGPVMDRELELAAATGLLDDWTRYAR